MNPDYLPLVLGFIGAAIPVVVGAMFVRRKTQAETADIITRAAGTIVQQMENRVKDLEERIAGLLTRIADGERREAAFMARIRELELEVSHLRGRLGEEGTA